MYKSIKRSNNMPKKVKATQSEKITPPKPSNNFALLSCDDCDDCDDGDGDDVVNNTTTTTTTTNNNKKQNKLDTQETKYTRTINTRAHTADTHFNAHADTYSNTHTDTYSNTHTDTYSNTHTDTYSNSNAHADTYSNSNSNSNAHSNTKKTNTQGTKNNQAGEWYTNKKNNWNKTRKDNEWSNRRPPMIREEKPLYLDLETGSESNEEFGNNEYLNSSWTVWIHKVDCKVWTEQDFKDIYVINSIGSFWRFFNNFHLLDKTTNQFFIMRNQIKPIWEDNDNRRGGTCSIKLDCYSKYGKMDVGSEVMTCICLLMMNETLIPSTNEINGISYAIKNRSVYIKIWCKNGKNDITESLPVVFFSKLNMLFKASDRGNNFGKHKCESKISLLWSLIKPEDELDS